MSEQAVDAFFRYFRYRADHIEAMGAFTPTDPADANRSSYRPEQHIMLAALIESLAGYQRGARNTGDRVVRLLGSYGGPWFERCSWPSIREHLLTGNPQLPKWAREFEKRKPFDEQAWSCADDPRIGDLPCAFPTQKHLYGAMFYAQRNGWLHGAEYAETDDELNQPKYAHWTPALPEHGSRSPFRPTFGSKFVIGVLRGVLSGLQAECLSKRINPCTWHPY